MNLKELKLSILADHAQIVVFEKEGTIIDSCESLVPLNAQKGSSIYEFSPLLLSIQESIATLGKKDTEEVIELPAVAYTFPSIEGIFDFEIKVHPQNIDWRIWLIVNRTDVYQKMQEVQQERNLLLIDKQKREDAK